MENLEWCRRVRARSPFQFVQECVFVPLERESREPPFPWIHVHVFLFSVNQSVRHEPYNSVHCVCADNQGLQVAPS